MKYIYEKHTDEGSGYEKLYAVVGDKGAVHFWVSPYSGRGKSITGEEWYGGIETHWREQPDWASEKPSQEHCWLLQDQCWHDGSSLQAEEKWIPLWVRCKGDLDTMFLHLEQLYWETFEEEKDEEAGTEEDGSERA